MEQTAPETIDLRDYIEVIRRQWRLVVGITLALSLTAVGVSLLQTPVYEATAELAVEPIRSGSDAALEDLLLRDEIIETERRVLTSRNITDRVIEDLALDVTSRTLLEMVTVRAVPNTRVLTISASDTDAAFAASVANSFATSYLDYRRDRALDEVTAARGNLDQRVRDTQAQIDAIDRELGTGTTIGGLQPDDEALVAQRDALAQQLALLQIQMAALDPGSDAIRGGGEILVPADTPLDPVSPRPARTGVLAFVLGLLLGVGAAFLRDHFDDAIRSEDDVVRAGGGHTIVGRLTSWDDEAANERLITLVDPFAGASEEFQAMAANVRFALIGREHSAGAAAPSTPPPPGAYAGRSVAVTSASPGEGKTTVAGNLAVAAASAGRRVILVGADLRRPTLAARFGLAGGVGLTDLLVNAHTFDNQSELASHLVDVGVPRLRVLPAGSIPPNPTELLASNQMAWLHRALVEMADLVIYDTPPVLPVADTLEISQHTDLALVVAKVEKCHRRELSHAVERLEAVGTSIGGLVVNGVEQTRGRYGYGYGYGYAPEGDYRPRTEQTDEKTSTGVRAIPTTVPRRAAAPVSTPPTTAPSASSDDADGEDADTWLFKNR